MLPPSEQEAQFPDERALASRCLAGHPGAWEEFVRSYAPKAESAARMVFHRWGIPLSPGDLADIVQETLLVFLRRDRKVLRNFRWECSLSTYVRTVAASRAVNHRKNLRATPALARDLSEETETLEAATVPPEAETLAQRAEEGRILRNVLDRLSPRDRRALLAFYWHGLSIDQTARLLGLAPVHARVVLSRARRRLKALLTEKKEREV